MRVHGAFPGEDGGLVLLEMVVGSVHPAAVAAGSRDTRTATALVGAIRERVIADLRTAAALAREREQGPTLDQRADSGNFQTRHGGGGDEMIAAVP